MHETSLVACHFFLRVVEVEVEQVKGTVGLLFLLIKKYTKTGRGGEEVFSYLIWCKRQIIKSDLKEASRKRHCDDPCY